MWWPFKYHKPGAGPIKVKIDTNPNKDGSITPPFYLIETGEDKRNKVLSRRKFKKGMNEKEYKVEYKIYRYKYGMKVKFNNDVCTTIGGSFDGMRFFKAAGLGLGEKLSKFLELDSYDLTKGDIKGKPIKGAGG